MKIWKWSIGAAVAGMVCAAAGGASAQSGDLIGCWSSGTSPVAKACFGQNGTGLFLLVWDQGRCGGNAYVNDTYGGTVRWEVPRQADSCIQEGAPERLARREYTCSVSKWEMRCRETIILDNGEVWQEKDNVVFNAQ